MKLPSSIITEKDVFNGKKLVTISVEVPEELATNLNHAHIQEITEGNASLTIEQFNGGVLQLGYNWLLYSGLKQFFEK